MKRTLVAASLGLALVALVAFSAPAQAGEKPTRWHAPDCATV